MAKKKKIDETTDDDIIINEDDDNVESEDENEENDSQPTTKSHDDVFSLDVSERRKLVASKAANFVNKINKSFTIPKSEREVFGGDTVVKLAKEIQHIDFMKTGIFEFDTALGGIPLGKCILIYGSESSCKSTFAFHCAKQSALLGFKPIIVETENTFNPQWAKTIMGEQYDDLILIDNNFDSLIYNTVIDAIKSEITNLIIFDSVSNIVTEREKKKIMQQKITDDTMTEKARSINKLLNALPALLRNRKIGVIFINQARDKMNAIVPQITFGGGHELRHIVVSIVQLKATKSSDSTMLSSILDLDDDRQLVRFKFEKSKIGNQEGLTLYSHFIKRYGFDTVTDLIDNGIKYGFVNKSKNGIYEFKFKEEEIKIHGFAKFREYLIDNPEAVEYLTDAMSEKFKEDKHIVIIK